MFVREEDGIHTTCIIMVNYYNGDVLFVYSNICSRVSDGLIRV